MEELVRRTAMHSSISDEMFPSTLASVSPIEEQDFVLKELLARAKEVLYHTTMAAVAASSNLHFIFIWNRDVWFWITWGWLTP